jgi:FtsH-binding integral membrane protein
MADDEAWRDALWKVYQDNHAYVRHHEVQRSSVATSIIAIASALLAVAAFDRTLTASDLPLLAVVTAIGLFGIFFSRKQYERTCLHIGRADALVGEIEKTLDGRSLLAVTEIADAEHSRRFRLYAVGMNRFWILFYAFIAMIGAVLALLALAAGDGLVQRPG